MKSRLLLIVLAFSALLPDASFSQQAQPSPRERRVRILVNGLYNVTGLSFDETSTFTAFLEEGTSTRSYDGGKGFVFEAGAIFSITKALGVMGSFEIYNTDFDATFSESIPHPLYFGEHRSLSGEQAGLSYNETAVHVDAVYTRALSSLTVDLFAGPSFFITSTEVISSIGTNSEYPFDEVTLSSVDTVELDDSPVGFNAGGSLTFRITDVIGAAVQGRYSFGSVSIEREGGEAIDIDAGGFRMGGGIRIAF